MNLFCPTCDIAQTGRKVCPRCGGRLITPAEAFSVPLESVPAPPELIRHTATARVIVGTVVAFGLFFAAREWVSAGVLSAADVPLSEWWAGTTGEYAGYALAALAATAGGLLAGAGRPQGAATGMVVGMACGGLFLVVDANAGRSLTGPAAVSAAVAAVLASAAGLAGARIWPAAVEPPMPNAGSRGSSMGRLIELTELDDTPARPTSWLRIGVATAVAVAGVIGAMSIRDGLKSASAGSLNLGNPAQVPTVTLEIAAIVVAAAALLAGANTGAGVRHGLILGSLTACAVIGLVARSGWSTPPPLEGLLALFEMSPDLSNGQSLGTAVAALLVMCGFGGWLGGQVFPPLAPAWMQKRMIPMS